MSARTGTLKNPTKCLWRWEPDRRSNFFFSPPAHLCAVTCMTEISLIVTLNNQFNSTQLYTMAIQWSHGAARWHWEGNTTSRDLRKFIVKCRDRVGIRHVKKLHVHGVEAWRELNFLKNRLNIPSLFYTINLFE